MLNISHHGWQIVNRAMLASDFAALYGKTWQDIARSPLNRDIAPVIYAARGAVLLKPGTRVWVG